MITIPESVQPIIRDIAKARHENNRAKGVKNRQVGPQSWEDTELEGLGGEFAFCMRLNVMPDLTTEVRSGGVDCLVDGIGVDVKTTKYENGALIARPGAPGDAEIYALMVGTFPDYRYAGWAWADDLLRDETLVDWGYGPTHHIIQRDLKKMRLGRVWGYEGLNEG